MALAAAMTPAERCEVLMVIIDWIGGIIALGLFGYLCVALLNPEMFS